MSAMPRPRARPAPAEVARASGGGARDRAGSEPATLEASLIATVAPVMRHLVGHARRRPAWKGGLTYQQYNVLRIADVEGPSPQSEVARRLMVSAPVVTRLVSALVEAGLIERRQDAKDRRTVLLAPTRAGRRRSRAMRRDLVAAAHELLEPLPEERRASIAAALEELQVLLPGHSARRR